MPSKFTEHETEVYYNAEDAVYRSFWDTEGSLHWGIFDDTTGDNFLEGCANLNRTMVEKAGIDKGSRVMDLGCGNGITALWLSSVTRCEVAGIDLSSVRIGNALNNLAGQPVEIRERVRFERASATELPFPDGSFTHVWSQATIYHVHDKENALREAYRVLSDGGLMVFDDLTKPRSDISEAAKVYVYDRLLFDTDFSFETYQKALEETGFRILEAVDLSQHLKTSYQCLARITREKGEEDHGKYRELSYAYEQMVQAVDNGELGWGLYLCRK